jgi:HlyD family secretion protein
MKQSWARSLIGLLVVSGVSYGVFRATRPSDVPAGFLYGSGHIEGTEIRIASEVSGRVTDHALLEGEPVSQGQILVVVDPQTSRDELRVRQGELTALRDLQTALDSQITLWTHHVETAARQLERARTLRAADAASDEEVDLADDTLREAEGQLGNLQGQRDALDGQISSAEARAGLAESQVEKTNILSPNDGTVLVRAVEVGELVQAGQVLALIVDLDRLELKIYVPEADLGKLRLGSEARLSVSAFPDRYFDARVARVDDYAQFTPRDIHLPEERTRMVYGVTLALDNPEERLKPGMPADAWIRWDAGNSWPASLPVPVR